MMIIFIILLMMLLKIYLVLVWVPFNSLNSISLYRIIDSIIRKENLIYSNNNIIDIINKIGCNKNHNDGIDSMFNNNIKDNLNKFDYHVNLNYLIDCVLLHTYDVQYNNYRYKNL